MPEDEPDAGDAGTDEGRYLYCVVDVSEVSGVETGTALDESGVDGEVPYLVVEDGLGAVVQERSMAYTSTDETTVKRWLLQHQGVVDAAHERFGTPLPVRFDTILRGDDGQVAAWLGREASTLRPALERFAGHNEYRVEMSGDSDEFASDAASSDDRLDELQSERDEADSGTAFLKSKQIDQRERSLAADRWQETAASLRETVERYAVDLQDIDRSVSSLEDADGGDDADFESAVALLADEEAAEALGEELDEIAARPGIEIRYTGPWPPYTFAPTLGAEE
jgi:hypothetical protein